jgi:benzoyl-CoA reductase/2-hydroxyglutaryl-CoA dehydratase subunit BcrC/BadD/HgdB
MMKVNHMNAPIPSLLDDEFENQLPAKRILHYVQTRKKEGFPMAGIYCAYAPMELMYAMGITPVGLCAFSQVPIPAAEAVLPVNLCPLIKSSFGFIQEGTCPFYSMSDVVIAETTCDGKKKMFELISEIKPTHVMDLPQLADEPEALENWTAMIRKLQGFLERETGRKASDADIENSIVWSNRKNRLMRKIFDFAAELPPAVSRQEMNELLSFAALVSGQDVAPVLESVLEKLEKRVAAGIGFGTPETPRVLVSGCPVGGDAEKIYRIIEETGAVIVALEACSGMKIFMGEMEENTEDPVRAIARRYLEIPCSCMTPNQRRLTMLSEMINKFQPHLVVDFILQACHAYNVESHRVESHVTAVHNVPFLKIESDYSDGDNERIRTRVEAVVEMIEVGCPA